MSIKALLVRVGIVLSVATTVAIGQTNPPAGVKFGNLTWMKQNLNIETPDSWCYDDNPFYCAKYGRNYTWDAAKDACASMGGGWRLPTREEWNNLVETIGGVRSQIGLERNRYDYDVAGKKLKSKSGWDDCWGKNGNGTDDYGFSALPGGYHRKSGSNYIGASIGEYGYWWSATEWGKGVVYTRDMSCFDSVVEGSSPKEKGLAVRCVTSD